MEYYFRKIKVNPGFKPNPIKNIVPIVFPEYEKLRETYSILVQIYSET
jgi:hypothetical protein